uniref:NBS-containing resistance-like protein n=1 Tax=Tanacetum cinerariifolium TaxID=118510 RepID=A0A6L2M659_TANCI|nr:NBS-containing resistance-like protein [Tanacetum cinerariifolium]
MRKHGYGYFEEIVNRLTNLSGDDVADFAIALRMFTRSLINVTKPDTTRPVSEKDTHTIHTKTLKDSFMSTTTRGTGNTKNIDIEYLPKRIRSTLEKKRAHCMIKDINKLLKERRMMRSLEKFRFTSYATGVGFQHSKSDYSLFMFHRGFDIAYLLLYVVDMILRYPSSTFLQQSTYGDEIFDCAHMQKYNTCRTHVDIESKLGANELTLSRSSSEAEYRGVANVVVETAWVRNLFRELYAPLFTDTLTYCDIVSVVFMSTNSV